MMKLMNGSFGSVRFFNSAHVLVMLMISAPGLASDASGQSPKAPAIERDQGIEARIDTEDFEFSTYLGALSLVDFDVNPTYGLRLGYHLTEHYFMEWSYGVSQASDSSFERLNDVALLSDDERDWTATTVNLGWQLAPGEFFITQNKTLTAQGYAMLGFGKVSFAGQSETVVDVGVGLRTLLNDWLALRFDVKDRIFKNEVLGRDESSHNFEFTTGLSVFF